MNNLKFNSKETLSREQLISVFGGGVCANNATGSTVNWACADGSASGSARVCVEHFQAYAAVISDFCNAPTNIY